MENQRAINGIPVKLRIGENDMATVYLASGRKCPELLGMIKDVNRAERAEAKIMREIMRAGQKFSEDFAKDDPEFDAKLDALARQHEDAVFAKARAVQDFIVKAMLAAGYALTDIDMYLPCFDAARFQEIAQSIMVGCGRLDFFSEPNQPGGNLKST